MKLQQQNTTTTTDATTTTIADATTMTTADATTTNSNATATRCLNCENCRRGFKHYLNGTIPHHTTGYEPFYLLYGRSATLPIEISFTSHQTRPGTEEDLQALLLNKNEQALRL